jgi:hypothetical protein
MEWRTCWDRCLRSAARAEVKRQPGCHTHLDCPTSIMRFTSFPWFDFKGCHTQARRV